MRYGFSNGMHKKTCASNLIFKRRTKDVQWAGRVSDRTRIPLQQTKP